MTKIEKLREVKESIKNVLADMETEVFVKNIEIKTKNTGVSEAIEVDETQNRINNYL
jgi:copper chaperone CopZ